MNQVCELIGIYLLSLLVNTIDKKCPGLYHMMGNHIRNINRQKINLVKMNAIKIFKEVGFKIEIQTPLK